MLHKQTLPIRIGSQDYTFSALTLTDWEDFATAYQFDPYNKLKRLNAPQEDLDKTLALCIERQGTMLTVLNKFMQTTTGIIEACFLSVKKVHPKMTREELKTLLDEVGQDTAKSVLNFIMQISIPPDNEKKVDEAAIVTP